MKSATLAASAGILYIFISRSLATFIPQLFTDYNLLQVHTILSLLAVLLYILFYILMYYKFAIPGEPDPKKKTKHFKRAIIAGILGYLLLLPIFIKAVLKIYDIELGIFLNPPAAGELILLLASALCALYFAVVFYEETRTKVSARLNSAAKIAVIGASCILLIRTYLFFNYYYSSQFRWAGQLTQKTPYILIVVLLFIFYALVNFLWAFYLEQDRT